MLSGNKILLKLQKYRTVLQVLKVSTRYAYQSLVIFPIVVYLRKKKVKGVDYLYLVKSTWDKERKTSRQETIKYLGESTSVTRDDIPAEFREDAKINSFLLQNTPKDREKREKLIEQLRTKLLSSLTEGSLKIQWKFTQHLTQVTHLISFMKES